MVDFMMVCLDHLSNFFSISVNKRIQLMLIYLWFQNVSTTMVWFLFLWVGDLFVDMVVHASFQTYAIRHLGV